MSEVHLLPVVESASRCKWWSCCIRSKAACLILLWNFAGLLVYETFSIKKEIELRSARPIIVIAGMSIIAMFAPIAGLLTDLKCGRYKAVTCTSYFLLTEVALIILTLIVGFSLTLGFGMKLNNNTFLKAAILVFAEMIRVTSLVFFVNSIRFGMDQLHDSPTEASILFIHWYVWIQYICFFITNLAWNLLIYDRFPQDTLLTFSAATLIFMMLAVILGFLTLSLCVAKFKKTWFLIEPVGINPYKLVYGVVKFACQHKVPLKRSAFTYCEEEFPSRIDLGKIKYGGPFTTKQVEDVKAFCGILKVVSFLGPVFFIKVAAQSMLPFFAVHSNIYRQAFVYDNMSVHHHVHLEGMARHIFISNGLLSPLLVVVSIPLYLCFIRPHISFRIPGMLKRIGLGTILLIVSLLVALAMDVVVHEKTDTQCMLSGFIHKDYTIHLNSNTTSPRLYQNAYFFVSQNFIAALANMLIDVAVLEFILSQSPYSMKGLLLGYFFSMQILFEALAIALMFPFEKYWNVEFLSCGSGLYLGNITIGVLGLAFFTFVAKKYKYRTVNEPYNDYRYAEEYYSNIP